MRQAQIRVVPSHAILIAGVILAVQQIHDCRISPLGTFYSTVYKNPGDGNRLSFDYWVTISSDSPKILTKSNIGDFQWQWTTITDVGTYGFGQSTAGNAPTWTDGDPYSIYRKSLADAGTLDIFWQSPFFGDGTTLRGKGLGPDDYSKHIYFVTDQLFWGNSTSGNIDGGITSQAHILVPAPEPGMLAGAGLLGLGLLGFWGYRRNKK